MELLKDFPGRRILRRARMVGNDKKVQIYLSTFKYLVLSNGDLKHIDNSSLKKKEFGDSMKTIDESEQATIAEFSEAIANTEHWSQYCKIRLWKVDAAMTTDKVHDYIV